MFDQHRWCVLFFRAHSPGSVLRLIERHCAAWENATDWLLSEPAPPHGFRALIVPNPCESRVPELAEKLLLAFPPEIVLLRRQSERWFWRRWDQEGGSQTQETEFAPVRFSWLLPRRHPAIVWARSQGLPVQRIPGVGRSGVTSVDYTVVAALDQRQILVEDSPRLYRFSLTAAPVRDRRMS